MPIEITMPRLSDTMESGTVIKWNVKEGDTVAPGDVLADIETDKATMELEAYDEGTVATLLLAEGQSAPVGQAIAVLAEEDENADEVRKDLAGAGAEKQQSAGGTGGAPAAPSATAVAEPPTAHPTTPSNGVSAPAPSGGRVFASPLAKKIAEERGVDLASVTGTGPGGRIVKKDVESAQPGAAPTSPTSPTTPTRAPSAAPTSAPPMEAGGPKLEAGTFPLSNMRRTIAKRLVDSKRSIPHYQVTVSANMDPLLAMRKSLNGQLEAQGVKLSVNDFLVRACALAMHEHPFVNSRWIDKGSEVEIEILPEVNVGVAIALPIERGGGLVVATLRGADRIGLRQISSETKRLAEKARTRGLTVEEMDGATFTISNLGMFGVEHFTAIINPPNVAILAVGGAIKKPVVRGDEVTIGSEMSMTMSSDHRVVDGAMAAQYLATVRGLLENPAAMLV